jgi:hypothetical protein
MEQHHVGVLLQQACELDEASIRLDQLTSRLNFGQQIQRSMDSPNESSVRVSVPIGVDGRTLTSGRRVFSRVHNHIHYGVSASASVLWDYFHTDAERTAHADTSP